MRKPLTAALGVALWLLAAFPAGAADLTATVAKITGKAQVQKGSDWIALKVGQVLPAGATVSTGFRSELQLKIGPSTVTVKPLSRLTIQSLVANGTEATTDLYLKVGKIDAEVNKSDTVQTQKFTVKSPVATASVRGTAFSFDGVNLEVARGLVNFTDGQGNQVSVPFGESARAAAGKVIDNLGLVAEDSTTQSDSGSDYGTDSWTDEDWAAFFETIDYDTLLEILSSYDWPTAYVSIGGISP